MKMYFRFNMLRPPAYRANISVREVVQYYSTTPIYLKSKERGKFAELDIVSNKKMKQAWPPVENVAEFTIRCCNAGLRRKGAEALLTKTYRLKEWRRCDPEGLTLYYNWNLDRREDLVIHMLMHFENNILKHSQTEESSFSKRAEYLTSIWRIMHVYEASLKVQEEQGMKTVKLLENFSRRCRDTFNLQDMRVYLSLADLQIKQDAIIPEVDDQMIISSLTRNLNVSCKKMSPHFPRCLQFLDYESFLMKLDNDQIDTLCRISFLLSLSGVQWQKSNFSSSLQSLSNSTVSLLQTFSIEEYDSNPVWKELLVHMFQAWFLVAKSACSHKMEPALDYLLTQAQHFHKENKILGRLPSYILLLAAENSQMTDLVAKIKLPIKERHQKFERCYVGDNSNTVRKDDRQFYSNDLVRIMIEEYQNETLHVQAPQIEEVRESSDDEVVPEQPTSREGLKTDENTKEEMPSDEIEESGQDLSPEVQRDLLDMKLLQYAVRRNGNKVLEAYMEGVQSGVLPSLETVEAMTSLFSGTEDLESLNLLVNITPSSFPGRDLFYQEVNNIQVSKIIENWQNEHKLKAWIEIVELYRSLLNDRKSSWVSDEALKPVILKIRQFCKLIIEDNIRREKQFLPALRSGSLKVASEHGDVYLLLTYWEALLFSTNYEHQVKADELLQEIPDLVPVMIIDPVIARAEKYKKEDIFRKLIEINLRYNGTEYNKSRTFEALLSFLTTNRRLEAAEETIRTAKSLDIRITADYLSEFLKFRESRKNQRGIFQSIRTILTRKDT